MNTPSWLHLAAENPAWQLPAPLRAEDAWAARDVGWVEQMLPFLGDREAADGWALDPFAGLGTTLLAGWLQRRPTLGVERDAHRCTLARQRLVDTGADPEHYPVVHGSLADPGTRAAIDAVPRRFTLCLTNIPYFGAPAPAHRSPGQLYGHVHYEPYLQELREVFVAVHQVLAPGAWCVVMAQNLRLGGRFIPLAWDVARLLGERFELHEERLLVYDKPADAPGGALGPPTNRAHEYALVCRKPDAAALSIQDGQALLAELRRDGFEVTVIGSFARALAGAPDVRPQDIDLLCRGGDAELSRLVQWLEHAGFRIESWNAPLGAPISRQAMGYRHYVRARRIDHGGRCLQVDVMLASAGGTPYDGGP